MTTISSVSTELETTTVVVGSEEAKLLSTQQQETKFIPICSIMGGVALIGAILGCLMVMLDGPDPHQLMYIADDPYQTYLQGRTIATAYDNVRSILFMTVGFCLFSCGVDFTRAWVMHLAWRKRVRAYRTMLDSREATELAIPKGLEEDWDDAVYRHRKEMKRLGGVWPDWKTALSDNYDIVRLCTPLLERIENDEISGKNRRQCERLIKGHFDGLAEHYLKPERELYASKQEEKTALNEGVAAELATYPLV